MDKRKDNPIVVKILCVVASFALWLYINGVENPVKTDRIKNVPVTIVNSESLISQGLTIIPNQEFTVDLLIKAPNLELNKLKADQFTLVADVSGYAFKPGEFKVKVDVKEKPPGDYTIIDTDLHVKVKLDQYAEKVVPVKLDINVATKSGFNSFNSENKVTNAKVSGPAQFVNVVSYVMAKENYKDVDKDLSVNLPLRAYDQYNKPLDSDVVKVDPSSIDLFVPIRKTKTVGINIKTKGSPSNKDVIVKSVEVSPDKVDIAGDTDLLNTITSLDTEVVDLSTLTGNKTQDVKLIVPEKILLVNSKGFVTVKVTADKVVQKSFTSDINFNNLGADYNITSDKNKVTVVLSGIEDRINAINPEDIKCSVDLTNITEGDHTIGVTVKAPDGSTLISTSPQNVKVSITKKSTSTSGNNVSTNGENPQ